MSIVNVAVFLPVEGSFFYSVPEELSSIDLTGFIVRVPFGRRTINGVVTGYESTEKDQKVREGIKEIEDIVLKYPAFSREMLNFLQIASEYYFHPLGEVLKSAIPAGLSAPTRKLVVLTDEGKRQLESKEITDEMRGLLQDAQKKITLKRLQKKHGISLASLMELKEKNWIDIKDFIPPVLKPKTERVVRLKNLNCSDAIKRKAEKEFLKRLSEIKELRLSEVRSGYPSVYRRLDQLAEMGIVEIFERELIRMPEPDLDVVIEPVEELNEFQRVAVERVSTAIESEKYEVFLLHGVTGSGKTAVYIKLIEKVLRCNRTCIYLVPEISLTPQQVIILRHHFGNKVALLHSALSEGERFDEWRRIREGQAVVVIGARSAIFSPLQNIGLIIVDEEHDPSYKQEEKFRYNARDLALLRGRLNNSVVLLGSATPSIESYYHAKSGYFNLIELPQRVQGRALPEVIVVDMRKEKNPVISDTLRDAIKESVAKNEQVILFLNRRGFAPFVLCVECGFRFRCPDCSVSMVYHSYSGRLNCHYCNFSLSLPEVCPACRGVKLRTFGFGTERVEKEVQSFLPEAGFLRLDRDTTTSKHSYGKAYLQMKAGEKNILIGTQMVTKGFHFPGVTLVGIILAEQGLQFPDFRASERTFQLLMQVAGRSGRGEKEGRVIIQTYDPDQPAVQCAQNHDYESFYNNELHFREELGYPPFSHLVAIRLNGKDNRKVSDESRRAVENLQELVHKNNLLDMIKILGPAPSAISKIKGMFRWLILLKAKEHEPAHQLLAEFRNLHRTKGGVDLIIDVDPQSLI